MRRYDGFSDLEMEAIRSMPSDDDVPGGEPVRDLDTQRSMAGEALGELRRRRAQGEPGPYWPETRIVSSPGRSREDVWLSTYTAALTGLCVGLPAGEVIRGAQIKLGEVPSYADGEQRRRELAGAAALLANRAVQEWSLHWPDDPPAYVYCGRSDLHQAHVWMAGGGRGEPGAYEAQCPGRTP